MAPLDVIAIELEARRLRAEHLRRGEPVFSPCWALCLHLLGQCLHATAARISESLRPLFSWNPNHRTSQ